MGSQGRDLLLPLSHDRPWCWRCCCSPRGDLSQLLWARDAPMGAPFSAFAFLWGQSPPPTTVVTADSAFAATVAAARTEVVVA